MRRRLGAAAIGAETVKLAPVARSGGAVAVGIPRARYITRRRCATPVAAADQDAIGWSLADEIS